VERELAGLLTATTADELMITTLVHSAADRLRSIELVRGLVNDLPRGLADKVG
jgi:hypothetical protein